MLTLAIVLITAALVLYTSGVWAEHRSGGLRPWHAALFGLGLLCDASGTFAMSRIATGAVGPLTRIMMVTGSLALLLMLAHLAWAVVVLLRDRAAEKSTFHRLSLIVWGFWLVPYFTGAIGSMAS